MKYWRGLIIFEKHLMFSIIFEKNPKLNVLFSYIFKCWISGVGAALVQRALCGALVGAADDSALHRRPTRRFVTDGGDL